MNILCSYLLNLGPKKARFWLFAKKIWSLICTWATRRQVESKVFRLINFSFFPELWDLKCLRVLELWIVCLWKRINLWRRIKPAASEDASRSNSASFRSLPRLSSNLCFSNFVNFLLNYTFYRFPESGSFPKSNWLIGRLCARYLYKQSGKVWRRKRQTSLSHNDRTQTQMAKNHS